MAFVGIIGTGVMGSTVAERILNAGEQLVVYDEVKQAAEKAQRRGATLANSPAEVARKAKTVLLFLPGPKEVITCVTAADGLLSEALAGNVIVDMGTIDPETTEQMAKLALEKDVGYLDAPILGRPATVGQWALPVGGRKEDLDRCRSLFEIFASRIFHIGGPGSGNKVKLLNQLMFGAINAMTAEMMAIAVKLGISPKVLYETITASKAGTVSNLFNELGRRIVDDNYDNATFTVDLLVKDLKLAVKMAKTYKAPPLLARTIEFINEMSQAQGLGNKDTSMMWKSYQKIWNEQ